MKVMIKSELDKKYHIMVKFTSKARPLKFLNCIENIINHASSNVSILCTLDEDDALMNNEFIRQALINYQNSSPQKQFPLQYIYGTSKNKVDAINRDINLATRQDWGIIVNFSDDNLFEINNFDTIIRTHMADNFSDTDGCLHFNDGFTSNLLCTQSIIGRKYFDKFGYIYHPSYASLFCDNEFTEVAQRDNKIKYINQVICRHNHPVNIGGIADEQLKHCDSFWDADQANYNKRKANNFKD